MLGSENDAQEDVSQIESSNTERPTPKDRGSHYRSLIFWPIISSPKEIGKAVLCFFPNERWEGGSAGHLKRRTVDRRRDSWLSFLRSCPSSENNTIAKEFSSAGQQQRDDGRREEQQQRNKRTYGGIPTSI